MDEHHYTPLPINLTLREKLETLLLGETIDEFKLHHLEKIIDEEANLRAQEITGVDHA